MGSRVRIAAAACLVASGLFAGGASATIAFADPAFTPRDEHTNDELGDSLRDVLGQRGRDGSGERPKPDPTDNGTNRGPRTQTDSEHSGDEGVDKNDPPDNDSGEHKPGDPKPDPPKPDPPKPDPPNPDPPKPPEEPGCGEEKGRDDCEPGLPWWPWPWDPGPGEPPGPGGGGGGGGGGAVEPPSGRPEPPPQMQLPPELQPPSGEPIEPVEPAVVDAAPGPGVGIAAAELPVAPITLPVVVTPPAGLGGGGAGPASPSGPGLPPAPRGVTAEPPAGREPLPANVGSNAMVPPSSYRVGYGEYLRNAGLSQVAALAVPGVAGILVLTGAGGLVGYRQAKAGHAVHSGTARFIN